MSDFQVGDIVQLKSGGPKMTVEHPESAAAVGGEQEIRCRWFANDNDMPRSDRFPAGTLVKVQG